MGKCYDITDDEKEIMRLEAENKALREALEVLLVQLDGDSEVCERIHHAGHASEFLREAYHIAQAALALKATP